MVSDADAYDYTRLLYEEEQLCCGISSGAALYAGVLLAKKYPGKNIVIILPDDGNRYISTGVFNGLKIN
jgi:cysteine synthase A